jgi:hypothetical protein
VAAFSQEVLVIKDGQSVCQFPTAGFGSGQGLAVKYQECLR